MDFFSFLLGGMFVADALEECDRCEIDNELYENYIYELEQEKERLRDYYALKYANANDMQDS